MKIAIIGWYGMKNVGDESFRSVFKRELAEHELFFCKNPSTLESKPDVVIFGGGGVVTPGSYFQGLTKEQPLYALGVDLATKDKQYNHWKTYNFKAMYTRSQTYAKELAEMGHPVKYCPDLAFALDPPEAVRTATPRKRLMVNLTDELSRFPLAKSKIVAALRSLSWEWEIHFVSFYCGKEKPDVDMHHEVASRFHAGTQVIYKTTYSSPEEMMRYLSQGDVVLSMRFHGVIFSTMMGVPFVAVSPTGKNSLFCAQEGIPEQFLDIERLGEQPLVHQIIKTYAERNEIRAKLCKIQQTNQALVKAAFEEVCQNWLV